MNIITKTVKKILGEKRFELDRREKKPGYKKSERRSIHRRKK